MKILKYVKDRNNVYKVYIDDEVYKLYDDVISNFNLLFKSEISNQELEEILALNTKLDSYYLSIKYINKKMRSVKEIEEYLAKKMIDTKTIKITIERLLQNHFLNDDIFLKCYLNDAINLSMHGPKRIKNELIKLGIDEEKIDDAINQINGEIWLSKINNYVDKKIKCNHNSSTYMLKVKIRNELINLGFDKEMCESIINKKQINDQEVFLHEYEKAKKSLSKKYSGYELEQKIKEKLYRKGFRVSEYEN